jgi:hypothetical protein
MLSFLKNVVAGLQKSSKGRRSAPAPQRRLRLESLEVRQLLSASPLVMSISPYGNVASQIPVIRTTPAMSVISLPSANYDNQSLLTTITPPAATGYVAIQPFGGDLVSPDLTPLFIPPATTVVPFGTIDPSPWVRSPNDFQNVCFNLHSPTGTFDQLTIQTQLNGTGGSSTFAGVWHGLGSNFVVVSGSLTVNGDHTDISFTWAGGHSFTGTITGDPGAYHIVGTMRTSALANINSSGAHAGTTTHLVGDQVHIPDLTGDKWRMASPTHPSGVFRLQIDSQTNWSDSAADFTGTWADSKPVTGTLRLEADGSITVTFDWTGDHQNLHFVGSISSDPSHSILDGTVYGDDGNPTGPGHVHGGRVQ